MMKVYGEFVIAKWCEIHVNYYWRNIILCDGCISMKEEESEISQ